MPAPKRKKCEVIPGLTIMFGGPSVKETITVSHKGRDQEVTVTNPPATVIRLVLDGVTVYATHNDLGTFTSITDGREAAITDYQTAEDSPRPPRTE